MGKKLAQLFLLLFLAEEKAAIEKKKNDSQLPDDRCNGVSDFLVMCFSEEEKENCVGGVSKERKMQVVKIAFEMTCAQ